MLKAVIFDLDGVVVDNNPFHRIAWSNFLGKKGIEVNEEQFNTVIFGTTGDHALRILMGRDITDEDVTLYTSQIDAAYREIISSLTDLNPVKGLRELLVNLKESGITIALATSAPDDNINLVLSVLGLHDFFGVIVGKSQVKKGKPHPEVYLTAMKELAVQSTHCIVFEDSVSGIRAAKAAGLCVIGVTTSICSAELLANGVQSTIDDYSGLAPTDLEHILGTYISMGVGQSSLFKKL